jgi:DNA polymerase-1
MLVGHNISYDNAVVGAKWPDLIPLIFAKYDRDEITDTMIRQQLLDIAGGCFRGKEVHFAKEVVDEDTGEKTQVRGVRWIQYNYGLTDLTYRSMGYRLSKEEDTWRKKYGQLMNVPLEDWPEEARKYALEDARGTLGVFEKQEEHADYIPDQFRQARYAWALHLTSTWGLRTHAAGVDILEKETIAALAEIEQGLKDAGLVRHDGSRDTKKAKARMLAVCAAAGKTVRLTDKGGVSLDSDACKASEDDLLEEYAELTSLKAVINKDIPVLRSGVTQPIHTNFGMAASGRSTSASPNVQNPRRLKGIREAFVPREGKVFAQADFNALELRTLAQTCITLFGHSELGRVLNAGLDPHTDFACSILGVPYSVGVVRAEKGDADEEFDNARQTAKVANFGFPGGLGPAKLCLFARKTYKVKITEPRAKELKAAWLQRWPEMQDFFRYVGDLIDSDTGNATLKQLFSNRWRGGAHYTAACNSFFQGLGSDAAKNAHYLVTRACYAEPESALYGSRPVNFVHDESIVETDDGPGAHDVAMELGRVMVKGANEFLPDVPAVVKPLLARCWSKSSKPKYDANKRLIPCPLVT